MKSKYSTIRNKPNRNSGFSSAIVLAVIVFMFLLGTSLLGLSENARIASIRRSQEIAAKCAADAGLTKVLFDLNEAYLAGNLDLANLPLESSVDIENFTAKFGYTVSLDAQGDILIDSTGFRGPCSKTVHCRLMVYSPRFEHVLFADNFRVKNNVIIDGYNSNFGVYGGSNVIPTSIGTNNISSGSVDLDNIGYLNGDISVGPNGDPYSVVDKGKHFDVTGNMEAAEEEKNLPVINAPILPYKGFNAEGTITENGRYDQLISTSNNEIITIEGDIILHIEGPFELDNGAQVLITEGSSLTLYVGGDFDMSNGGKINNLTQRPPNCKVFSTAVSEVNYTFDNVGEFFGAIYAPNGIVDIKNNAIIYGSIVGKRLSIDNSAEIYGDKALLEGTFGDDETLLVIGNWWE